MTIVSSATLESNEVVIFAQGLPQLLVERGSSPKGVNCDRTPCHKKGPPNPDLCGGDDGGGGGGADDYVSGASGCMNLAITDPAKAIGNADSHEYFAEDH